MVVSNTRPVSVKKESLRQDLISAWDDYHITGLHVPAEGVEEWIASWWDEKPGCGKTRQKPYT